MMEVEGVDRETYVKAVEEHAVYLGMDLDKDRDLLWIAEQALHAGLPEGWEQGETEDGSVYYYNVGEVRVGAPSRASAWNHGRFSLSIVVRFLLLAEYEHVVPSTR